MRRGSTLVEMTAMIGIAALLFAGAFEALTRLQRLATADPQLGTRAELACAQLRRDLATGQARRAGAALQVSPAPGRSAVLWQVEDGQLVRDGRLQLAVTAFTVEEDAGGVTVALTPAGLPARRIEGPR